MVVSEHLAGQGQEEVPPKRGGIIRLEPVLIIEAVLIGAIVIFVSLAIAWLKLDLDRTQQQLRQMERERAELEATIDNVIKKSEEREAQLIEALCADRYNANESGCTLANGVHLKYSPWRPQSSEP